jgi:hypothetical protein
MVRKTRKHFSSKHKKQKGIFSIPELRRSFEHIEEFVDDKIAGKEGKEHIVKDLRKEWSRVFLKELDKKSAEAFVTSRMSLQHKKHGARHRTIRRTTGGAGAQLANTYTPIAGAPNDYTTRQGIYLAPGQIPDKNGHLPLSSGAKSNFGSFIQYVQSGFGVGIPEPGQRSDPVPGQTRFPTTVPAGMGSNEVHFAAKGGSYRKTRKTRRGGGTVPSSVPEDMKRLWRGQETGVSPSMIQGV